MNSSNKFEYRHSPAYLVNPNTADQTQYVNHSEDRSNWRHWTTVATLNYVKDFGDHSINALVGTERQKQTSRNTFASIQGYTTVRTVEDGDLVETNVPAGFLDQNFPTLGAGLGGTAAVDGTMWEYTRTSFFGRLNYGLC